MTKPEIIKEIKMNGPIFLTHRYLYSLDMNELKTLYKKYVSKHKKNLESNVKNDE